MTVSAPAADELGLFDTLQHTTTCCGNLEAWANHINAGVLGPALSNAIQRQKLRQLSANRVSTPTD